MRKLGLTLICASFFAAAPIAAGQPAFRTELENRDLRVVRIRLGPHERLPMHEIPPHVTIWLTDASLKITYADNRSEVQHFRSGQVLWVALGKHAGENLGDEPIEFVAVEPKRQAPPK